MVKDRKAFELVYNYYTMEFREYDNLDTLLVVLREKWAFKISINTQYVMVRRITEIKSMNYELWFAIGKSKACLSKQEFCLITKPKFGPHPNIFIRTYELSGDVTKMALILIANNILFGENYRRKVTSWLLSLVEDIDAWNVFLWGQYIWRLIKDYLLKWFKVAAFWAMEIIPVFQKLIATFDPKDDVYPFVGRRNLGAPLKEATREYWVDINVPLSEGCQYMPTRQMEDQANWGIDARIKGRNLKEKRVIGLVK
ncbi:Uncharacterized protein TCM_039247 [Theobroma cacao]|uniref:DUF1985 domain-containing protein n=1 Tax=Theobroma cacao TaxID=3641 RepID=A0A061GRV3_THECC|nr:Uncharacterized protein TCM_039247 [Theobroma cacao]